jgi:GNAT superfamily N-acetyltransferase
MPTVPARRTYLEMSSPTALRGSAPLPEGVTVTRERPCDVALYRALYAGVGGAHHWIDRLAWSDETVARHLALPTVAVWILRENGVVGGYFELVGHADGSVEISYFGLLPDKHGRGLGRHLLTRAVEEAWALGATRVWLHTCTLDGPAALPNYLARGFMPYRTEDYLATLSG